MLTPLRALLLVVLGVGAFGATFAVTSTGSDERPAPRITARPLESVPIAAPAGAKVAPLPRLAPKPVKRRPAAPPATNQAPAAPAAPQPNTPSSPSTPSIIEG